MKKLLCSLALLISTASNAAVFNHCSWNKPGVHPYVGGAEKGVNDYPDIPADVKVKLKDKIEKFQYDQIVFIRKDGISGGFKSEITDMHFGKQSICREVDRSGWKEDHYEVALVVCEQDYCLLTPTVCGNISRVRRKNDPSTNSFLPPSDQKGTMEEFERNTPRSYVPSTKGSLHELPEPSPLYLMALGIIAILLVNRKS